MKPILIEPDIYLKRHEKIHSMTLEDMQVVAAETVKTDATGFKTFNNIAVIRIQGGLYKVRYFMDETSTMSLRRQVTSAANDKSVKAIVLDIDSPGGSVNGIQELGDAIKSASQSKPVIAQVSGMMASAAYWVGSQASKIYSSDKTSMVGSIGVKMVIYDYSEMYKKDGVKAIAIDTGDFKSMGEPGIPITKAQIKDAQKIVDGIFKEFVQAVSEGRGLKEKEVMKSADGRVFLADEAADLGLIDGIRSFDETFSELRQSIEAGKKQAGYSLTHARHLLQRIE